MVIKKMRVRMQRYKHKPLNIPKRCKIKMHLGRLKKESKMQHM
ncbi:hypothetical protein LX69_00244 [Breznakibacter xylanolyticus]|uniref:Uncharacterized protein n=1 Tax=Breznakibacter xylanolyticus TaxID=990 RepID=A0A2W7QFV0_9BACT|nr:hypothetical protein LX69_00244 [Breznakibacter xylanolyticus]